MKLRQPPSLSSVHVLAPRGLSYVAFSLLAVAHAIARAAGLDATLMLDVDLGEAEALVVPLAAGSEVSHLKAA